MSDPYMTYAENASPDDYAAYQKSIKQQQMAEALRQQAFQNINSPSNEMAGRFVVAKNPLANLADILSVGLSSYNSNKEADKQASINKKMADILRSKFYGDQTVQSTPIANTADGGKVTVDNSAHFSPKELASIQSSATGTPTNTMQPMATNAAPQGGSMVLDGMSPDQAFTAYSADPQGYMKSFNESHGLDMKKLQAQMENEKLNRDVQTRGQDLTNARDVERNHLMYGMGAGSSGGLAPEDENYAQMIATGKAPFPTGAALKNPRMLNIVNRVNEINPNFNAANYQIGLNNEKQFTDGKLGNTVRSLNVANSHLDTLSKLSDALNNGDMQMFNKIGNAYAMQTGKPAPANFDAAKQVIGDEVVKAIVGSGGGAGDRDKAQAALDAAKSPAQLKGVVDTYKQLFGGQLEGMRRQYESAANHGDFNRFMSDQTKGEASLSQQPTNKPSVSNW